MGLLLAGGVALGAGADRAWTALTLDEGASCDIPGRQAVALAPSVAPVATALPVAAPCFAGTGLAGSAATGAGNADAGVSGGAGEGRTDMASVNPDCPQPKLAAHPAEYARLAVAPAPVVPAAAIADPLAAAPASPRVAVAKAPDEHDFTPALALAAVLGLVGVGAAVQFLPNRKRKVAAGLGFAGLAAAAPYEQDPSRLDYALADPRDPGFGADPAGDSGFGYEPHPHHEQTFAPAELPFDDRHPRAQHLPVDGVGLFPLGISDERRAARAARKRNRQRLIYAALVGGAALAIAAATYRMPIDRTNLGLAQELGQPGKARLGAGGKLDIGDPAEAKRRGGAGFAPDGRPRQPGERAGFAPLRPGAGVGGRNGAGGAIVNDPGGRGPGELSGDRDFGRGGNGGALVSDGRGSPNVGNNIGNGGGGGSGGGSGDALTRTPGSNITPAPGNGGGSGGGSGASSSGGASSGGASSGGGQGLPEKGSDPRDWIGNEPDHGGSSSAGGVEVPEPDTIGLLALGIIGLAAARSRRLRQRLAGRLKPVID